MFAPLEAFSETRIVCRKKSETIALFGVGDWTYGGTQVELGYG